MKSQKGVTLLSLIMYVVAMFIVIEIVATITTFFYSSTESLTESTESLGEFNKFNLEIVREIKQDGSTIKSIDRNGKRIVFSSGNIFLFDNKGIYKNKVKICSNVNSCLFKKITDNEKDILVVYFETDSFAKTIEYTLMDNKKIADKNPNIEENYMEIVNKEYIQDGLEMYFDAINNTGEGHSNTTTTWRDLSGNHNDGVLANVTWQDNCAVFNGTNSWVNCGEHNSDYQTLCVTFSSNVIDTGENQYAISNVESGGGGICINTAGKIRGAFHVNGNYRYVYDDELAIAGKKYSVTLTYDGTTEKMYINGNKITDEYTGNVNTIRYPNSSTVFSLGSNPCGTLRGPNLLNGKIYSVAIYNRALTAGEVMQNYQVDKERYGIED